MNKLGKFRRLIRNFFWWCAGVVPSVLEKCPTNHGRYTAIGVIMVAIAALAAVSFTYFLMHTFAISFSTALPFGALWGGSVFSFDRAILTSFRKNETGKISIAQRFLLTVALALVIGEPLLLQMFGKEIQFELTQKGSIVSTDARQKATARFQPEVDALENSNREIESRLDTLKADRDVKETAVIGEIEGTSGTGKKGVGIAADRKTVAFQEADAKYKDAKTESAGILSKNRERLAQIRNEIEEEIRRINAAHTASDGILAKHEALFNIIRTQPGAALVYLPLLFVLMTLESFPVSLKVFGKPSVYDVALEAEESEEKENLASEKTRRQKRENNVDERISTTVADGTIEKLRDQGEREIARKIHAEILRKIVEKEFKRQTKETATASFGEEILIEVVGENDLTVKLQLPENARTEVSLKDLAGDVRTIAKEIGAEGAKLQKAFSSKGHEIWEDLPLLPQLEYDQKLVLQFEPLNVI